MAYKPRKDIKVPESYIQKLRDTGSKKAALEKYGSSSDPKMREALRRFYGASAPAPVKDSSRTTARTLPKKSIPVGKNVSQAKPKSAAQKIDTAVRNVYKYAGPENFIAGGLAVKAGMTAGKAASKTAKAVSIAKNTRTAKTATGSKKNLARTKVGYAKGAATKSEVKQAKAAVRNTTAQKASSAARTGMDTARYYGSAAKNTSTRAQKAGEMRSTQQAVANAAKKKATSLKRAETTRVKKATSGMMGTAKIDKAKAAAKRASKAGK